MNNFFMFLLSGLMGVAETVLLWLFGGPENMHQAMGFKSALGPGVQVVFDILFTTFGMFNLTLPLLAIMFFFPIWVVDMVTSPAASGSHPLPIDCDVTNRSAMFRTSTA